MNRINAIAFAQLVKGMDGTRSVPELVEFCGLSKIAVYRYTRAMYDAGVCHIAAWEFDAQGRQCVKVYQMGAGRDATKPRADASKRMKQYRARQAQAQVLQLLAA